MIWEITAGIQNRQTKNNQADLVNLTIISLKKKMEELKAPNSKTLT